MNKYDVKSYWSEVAERINHRSDEAKVLAGDEEPFYRYKRHKFLKQLNQINYNDKCILEIGCGPGGNLNEIIKQKPKQLVGVDISETMLKMASYLNHEIVQLYLIDGKKLPFEDNMFDIVFTATVLQHNTNQEILEDIISEMARVSKHEIYIYESINKTTTGDDLCKWRSVEEYRMLFEKNGFELKSVNIISTTVSYYVAGTLRKMLNPKSRKEGQPLNKITIYLQNLILPITTHLDKFIVAHKNLAQLKFEKINLQF